MIKIIYEINILVNQKRKKLCYCINNRNFKSIKI